MNVDPLTWYVVHTKAHAERMARDALEEAGYTVLFPHYLTVARKRNKHREFMEVMRPLFPRYMFIGAAPGQGLYDANTAMGVATVLHDQRGSYAVPQREIDRIREGCDEDGWVGAPAKLERVDRPPQLPAGAEVNVVSGLLQGAPGVVVHDDGKSRHAVVEVSLLNRTLEANIAVADLVVVSEMRRRA